MSERTSAPETGVVRPAGTGRDGSSRVLWISLAASALFHLALVLAYPFLMRGLEPETVMIPVPGAAPVVQGTRIVQVVEIPDGEALPEEEEETPETVVPPRTPVAAPGAPVVAEPSEVDAVDPRTAAELLRPTLDDPELWRFVDPELTELTDEQLARMQLYGTLEALSDSAAARAAEAAAALDWTTTDAQGNQWGVSPGKLHLGKLTLPLPFSFTPPPGKRDETAQRAWEWSEIERAAASGAARESWKERAKEIRKRKEAERADTIPRRR